MTEKAKPERKFEMKFNPVQLATIHKESILKERKYEGKNFKYDYTFQLNSLFPYAEKPQLVSPSRPFTSNDTVSRQSKREYGLNKNPISEAFSLNKINSVITSGHQIPKEKYPYPITAAQEIGWYSKPLVDNSKWNYPVASTPISQFADSYFITMKINPFKVGHEKNKTDDKAK